MAMHVLESEVHSLVMNTQILSRNSTNHADLSMLNKHAKVSMISAVGAYYFYYYLTF